MITAAFAVPLIAAATAAAPVADPPGMIFIPGNTYKMGSDAPDAWPSESPAHRVRVGGFWMDRTEVTNRQFQAFVEATGYVTVAERPVDWEELKKQLPPGTPKPPDETLAPGSVVFTPPDHTVPLHDVSAWWSWVVGANWRHPEGPGSNLDGRGDHPVVQVAWEDANAYAMWAGKRLPTEAEWELAARGGLDGAPFVWGDEAPSDTKPQANIWQGVFPHRNTKADGYLRTAPVGTFPPNGYGLVDMAGNVWEWCADWYRADHHDAQARSIGEAAKQDRGAAPAGGGDDDETRAAATPLSPDHCWNPEAPYEQQRVTKGGSFLCHASYCSRYRPSARQGTSFDTGMSHVGFRCVKSSEPDQPQSDK